MSSSLEWESAISTQTGTWAMTIGVSRSSRMDDRTSVLGVVATSQSQFVRVSLVSRLDRKQSTNVNSMVMLFQSR